MRTVGVVRRHEQTKVVEIAEPFGVVAAIVPSTNPTSTAIYKILIAIKARCAIVLSPHPSAVRCITRAADIMATAARGAGAPDGSILWMSTVTLEGGGPALQPKRATASRADGAGEDRREWGMTFGSISVRERRAIKGLSSAAAGAAETTAARAARGGGCS